MAYAPVVELTRGHVVESIHYGAIAVVDIKGQLVAQYGDPQIVTFLRSAAKPFQVLPFLEAGGADYFHLTEAEIALACASHSGTQAHMAVLASFQRKVMVSDSQLLCGVHYPFHEPTAQAMRERGESPTSNHHNCSGKHTAMLAYAQLLTPTDLAYIDQGHPVQEHILRIFAAMCQLPIGHVSVAVDGCSAPNFAVPLKSAAFAYARLADPVGASIEPSACQAACLQVISAMIGHPDMVGGPDSLDTRVMQVCRGRVLLKAGAEGYQGIGILPCALGKGSPALGIAIKVADGDWRKKARVIVVIETLRQLGVLSPSEMAELKEFGPHIPVNNWRKLVVGEARPCFALNWHNKSLK